MVVRSLLDPKAFGYGSYQTSMFDNDTPLLAEAAPQVQQLAQEGMAPALAKTVEEEAVKCLAAKL